MQADQEPQPFLPKVGMLWFFIVATLVALALGIVRMAEQGAALATALVFSLAFLAIFFTFAGIFFLIAYLIGATDKTLTEANRTPENPFSDGTPSEQLMPPRRIEDV